MYILISCCIPRAGTVPALIVYSHLILDGFTSRVEVAMYAYGTLTRRIQESLCLSCFIRVYLSLSLSSPIITSPRDRFGKNVPQFHPPTRPTARERRITSAAAHATIPRLLRGPEKSFPFPSSRRILKVFPGARFPKGGNRYIYVRIPSPDNIRCTRYRQRM